MSSDTTKGFAAYKKKHPKLFKVIKIILLGDTVAQKIVHFYVYLILLGAILLYLPFALTSAPEAYTKIVNEDYITLDSVTNQAFSGLAKQYIEISKIPASFNINGYYQISENMYLIRDSVSNALKVVQVDKYTFLDAIFVAASAFSDTGLTTLIVRSTYSVFGQVIIALLIHIGGIGFIVISYMLWMMFKSHKKDQNAFSKAIILRAERGNSKLGGTTKTIVVAVIFILVAELIYAVFYALYFNFAPAYEQQIIGYASQPNFQTFHDVNLITVNSQSPLYTHNSPYAIWAGIFHSISSINNAGFDLFGANSLAPFRNDYHAVFLFITMTEFIIGGIGYPVIFEVFERIKIKRAGLKGKKHHFSLFTKVSLITTCVISVFAFVMVSSIEMTSQTSSFGSIQILAKELSEKNVVLIDGLTDANQIAKAIYGDNPTFNATWGILFETMSTRSAGFSTISNYLYDEASKGIFISLMFIGAAPSSTAGGIRTTTFAVICMAIWTKLRGRKEVRMFKRAISRETVLDSFICFILILFILSVFSVISNMIIDAQTPASGLTLLDVIYELSSAFGTVGLTTGVSTLLTSIVPIPLIFTIFLMIIGQLGVSTTLLTWVKKNPNGNLYSYPTEDLKIG